MARKIPLVALGCTVLTLVAAKLLLPSYVTSPRQARELVLRQDLRMMNAVITQYTLDKQLPPHSLDDLVVAGYLKEVPKDPMTGRKDTWTLKCSSNLSRRGIVGIDSGYKNTSNKGALRLRLRHKFGVTSPLSSLRGRPALPSFVVNECLLAILSSRLLLRSVRRAPRKDVSLSLFVC